MELSRHGRKSGYGALAHDGQEGRLRLSAEVCVSRWMFDESCSVIQPIRPITLPITEGDSSLTAALVVFAIIHCKYSIK